MAAVTISLESVAQRLQLVPNLGGGVASWDWKSGQDWTPIFRPWNGLSDDRYTLACFPLVPWSNRITQGGFEQNGVFHPIKRNRDDEAYPIHGDGWLQPWRIDGQTANSVQMVLESHVFDGNPYHYIAAQTFTLLPDGLEIILEVTHLGSTPLPYGLGLHPYFVRNDATRLRFKSDGVWLSGADPIPTRHTRDFPATWDYNQPAALVGPLIDNGFTGWDGQAVIQYPDRGFSVTMSMADCNGYSLMYRPPDLSYFCLEPITHPIDAFHMQERPGLVMLSSGQKLSLHTRFIVGPTSTEDHKVG
jgi:aldose 1-epimerase